MKAIKRNVVKDLIGKKVRHGSPGYELPEVISGIVMHTGDMITLEFESGCFTRMTLGQLRTFCTWGSIEYVRALSDAFECLISEDVFAKGKELQYN